MAVVRAGHDLRMTAGVASDLQRQRWIDQHRRTCIGNTGIDALLRRLGSPYAADSTP